MKHARDAEGDSEKKAALRITNQYHSKGGMAYDLKCEGVHLSLLFMNSDGGYTVEASASRMSQPVATITERGPTRADALRAVGRSWDTDEATFGLRVFDWEAIATMLGTVRAL